MINKPNAFEKNKQLVIDAIIAMSSAMKRSGRFDGMNPKKTKKESRGVKATNKGYKHVVGKTFLSRKGMALTPAQFRHQHLGRTSKRWTST